MAICRAQISKVCSLIPRIGIKKVFLLALTILVSIKLYVGVTKWMRTEARKKLQIPPDRLNYFMDNKDFENLEYTINTGKCKIMKFSPWDSAIQQFLKKNMKPTDCSVGFKNSNSTSWAYQDGTQIVLNETAVRNAGHSLSSLNCCYKGIVRQKQLSYMFGARNADRQVEYTSPCVKMDLVTTPEYEFVRVTCSSPWLVYWEQVVYSDSFFIPMLETKIPEKTREFWLHKRDEMPPSVVVLGIDALSRMNYYRSLPQTKEFMDGHGAVELLGYTKVGENTFPNAVAFLSGLDLSDPDVPYECIQNPYKIPHDDCPYIWKRFHAANYVTALVEDYPGLMIFNHMKLGFVEQPTDFYFRPFLLSVDQPVVKISNIKDTICVLNLK